MTDVVTLRQINRSYLARQLLLERSSQSMEAVIEHLIALQAQDVMPPYVGLWSRMQSFRQEKLHNALLERSVVRGTSMRATVHLSMKEDVLRILPKLLPGYIKHVHAPTALGGLMSRVDYRDIYAWGEQILENRDMGSAEIKELAARDWPDHDPDHIRSAIQWMLPLVQVPPRGLWKTNAKPRWAMAETWLGASFITDYPDAELVLRYIKAYGPVGIGDFQTWSRLTGMKEAMAELRPGLRVLRDEAGRELLDVQDAEWPDESTPAPVRLLGQFDNLWLSHKDRSRVLDDRHRLKTINNGIGRPTILVDGFVAGRYKVVTKKQTATLTVEPFRPYSTSEKADVEHEARALLGFLEPNTEHVIEFADTFL